ncbi:MAG: hypothetical protein AB1815_07125 [Bacillota bacterium]
MALIKSFKLFKGVPQGIAEQVAGHHQEHYQHARVNHKGPPGRPGAPGGPLCLTITDSALQELVNDFISDLPAFLRRVFFFIAGIYFRARK